MPFEQHVPRAFTYTGVRMFAPIASGVSALSNAREWIDIGETDDIRGALIAHLADSRASMMTRTPTGLCSKSVGEPIAPLAGSPGSRVRACL